jgi:transglutaminase-like putative cysteine protease
MKVNNKMKPTKTKFTKNLIAISTLSVLVLTSLGCSQNPTAIVENENSAAAPVQSKATVGEKTPARMFDFNYGAKLLDVPKDASVKVWVPIAGTSAYQTVTLKEVDSPSEFEKNTEPKYNNEIGFFETKAGEKPVEFNLVYNIVREEASIDDSETTLTSEQKSQFLTANRLVPITGKPQELLTSIKIPEKTIDKGQALYDLVEQHMKYDKSNAGYGNGDAVWACDSKTGNCTDFHSLFISLARSQSIPARFEIGFPLPVDKTSGKIGGYHCWAWFHVDGKGWAPVDISEADKHPELKDFYFGKLTRDRVAFSSGRDITLVPEAKSEPLNYFVYPHVEVDGKLWPKDKIELNFSFKEE